MRDLARRISWERVSFVLLLVSTGLFAVRLPGLADGDWSRLATSFGHHAWLLGWMLAFSFVSRGRSLRHVWAAFLAGFFTSLWLAVTLGDISASRLGASDPWHLIVAVPAVEELAKLVPLLIAVLAWRRRSLTVPGIVDMALMGTAVGAGFAVHEDALWQRLAGSGMDGTLGWIAPSFHTDFGFVVGHAGWTGLVGLGLGVWLTQRRRRRWTALIPMALLALAGVDHALWNDPRVRADWRSFLLDGWLVGALFLGGVILAIIVDTVVVQRRLDGRPARLVARLPRFVLSARNPVAATRRFFEWTTFLRVSALVAHGRWLTRGGRAPAQAPTGAPR